MKPFSKRVQQMEPSVTVALSTKANALKSAGRDIITMGVGEPDFNTPNYIKNAGIEAINTGHTRYTPPGGTQSLREAIAAKLQRDNGLTYTPNQIVVTCGGKQAISNTLLALIEENDEVIIATPYWVTYPSLVNFCGGTPIIIETTLENQFKLTPQQLEAAITSNTKVIILNTPSNPSGSCYSKTELEALGTIISKYDLYIISDEIYEKLVYDGTKHISIAEINNDLKERTILINGLSKSHAMTGWRLGYLAATKSLAQKLDAVQSQVSHHTSSISQFAAAVALNNDDGSIDRMIPVFQKRRDTIIELLSKIEGFKLFTPGGAFYAFPDISAYFGKSFNGKTIKNSLDFADFLLDVAGVAIVPGAAFGSDNCIRFSYATSLENIIEACRRVAETVKKLK